MPSESNPVIAFRWPIFLLPPLVLLLWLFPFRTWNVVWGDGVSMCPIFDKFYHSSLTFGDLWPPYWGHWVLCHRTVELLLGWATSWNLNAEIGFIYLTLLFDFSMVAWLLQDVRKLVSRRAWYCMLGVCSLFIFSANQVEIWTNGFNVGPTSGIASALGGITCLAKFGAKNLAFCVSLLAGVVASFSFGNGLTYWVAVAPLLYSTLRDDPPWWTKCLVWVGTAGVVIILYFHGLGGNGTTVSMGQSLLNIFLMPGVFFAYLFTCCGAGVFFLNGANAAGLPPLARLLIAGVAPVCVFAGVMGFGYHAWHLLRCGTAFWVPAAPWLTLGLYALFSAGLTTLARYSTFPLAVAISSRYIIFTQYLWLGLLVCLVLLAPRFKRDWLLSLGVLMAAFYLFSYANRLRYARTASAKLRQVRLALLSQPTGRTCVLFNENRDPAQLASFVDMERAHHLATFRRTPTP